MRGSRIGAAIGLLVALMVWAPAAEAAAPGNDNFADRQVLTTPLPIVVSADNVEATREEGEPFLLFGAGHTIWYEWEAPSNEFVTVGTCGTAFETEVGVYVGTAVNALTKIADTSDGGPGCPNYKGRQATFKAVAGTTYEIAVDGNGFYLPEWPKPVTEGAVELQIEATPPPANDAFESATPLTGRVEEEPGEPPFYFASTTGYSWGATKQSGEPDHAGDPGGASVWYSWTAPATGSIRLSAQGNWFQPLVTIYAGSTLSGLTPLASAAPFGGMEGVPVTAGTTYRIAVDGKRDPDTEEADTAFFWMMLFMELPPVERKEADPGPPALIAPDTTAPETSFLYLKKPKKPTTKFFAFRSSEYPSTFRCRLDSKPFLACGAAKTFKGLKPGRHTFEVAAIDAAGNEDQTPATARFRIPAPKAAAPKG
jgi:hypothetical protein